MAEDQKYAYNAAFADDIETRWQAHWNQQGTFVQPGPGDDDFDASKPKFYCLDMFPYPSGSGLHVGHPEGYTATDIVSRYKRMRGYNVLHPMGWDAFGLPAEQYAIQTGVHPALTTKKAIETFRRQLKRFGFSYDWSREFGTIDEDYYRWTQWIFLRIYNSWFDPEQRKARPVEDLVAEFESGAREPAVNPEAAEHGRATKEQRLGSWSSLSKTERRLVLDSWRLAYLGEVAVNWCPKLGTALANEEVIDGRSERGQHPVFRKPMRQWMFRITAYADRLLAGLGDLDWPTSTQVKQTDWIGRSTGAEVDFELTHAVGDFARIRIYTTRPDTLFGATYMVVAPEHPLVDAVLASSAAKGAADNGAIGAYVNTARNRSDLERQQNKEKSGVALGVYAENPVNRQTIPIWVADYVLMGYGHGAIMAVPAHDERDHAFATKFELPIVEVLELPEGFEGDCFAGEAPCKASSNDEVSLNGLPTVEAKKTIIGWLEGKSLGQGRVNFRIRDWLFSRQRYWGEPFPIVFDEDGHHHGVDPSQLPVVLPELADYEPIESDEPRPLLAKAADWATTTAGEAGVATLPVDAKVRRETNTMPGWAGSCWYHLRYCDPGNGERLIGREADSYWLGKDGVDLYIGGAEHAVLHLLYARFWHQVLHDRGDVVSPEPYRKLFHQGLIMSHAFQRADKTLVPSDTVENRGTEDKPQWFEKEGQEVKSIVAKMSKTLKNVVNPDDVISAYGADTFRLYEMYMGPLETSKPWNTNDIHGMHRFLSRAWRLVVDQDSGAIRSLDSASDEVETQLHRAIASVTRDIEKLRFNTAIAHLIEFVNTATTEGGLTRDQTHRFARVLAPFAPHIAEEVWHRLGETPCVSSASWPSWDEARLVDATIEIPIQIMGKLRARLQVPTGTTAAELEERALGEERIKTLLEGKTVRKVIVVPGKLVNVVAT